MSGTATRFSLARMRAVFPFLAAFQTHHLSLLF